MWKERTEALIGRQAVERLAAARVAVFGIGGVGSYAVEALARAGIGGLDLIDDDVYCETNLNRQLYATLSALGMYKTEAAKAHIHDINPDCGVVTVNTRFTPENRDNFDFSSYDYVIDAIDSTDCKASLIKKCFDENINIISSMGAGNRKDPGRFTVADIYSTSTDPLAKVMRAKLKRLGITRLKVVYSTEPPSKVNEDRVIGSLSCVTAAAGLMLAGEVIKDLINIKGSV
ncbi:MAG: tRNA threonylcarbamoyladenosine dehydratase [Eubacteriales bacterium]|nr:tRNA threonylcarbamoyladenosine dehydratase [Eubacteriales bacterium]